MADRFDPSAFIAAEKAGTIATVAGDVLTIAEPAIAAQPAENSHSEASHASTIAGIATIAASEDKSSIWATGPATLASLPRPVDMKEASWRALISTTKWLADDWADEAQAKGWHPLDFFGCNRDPSAGRLDRDGLAMLLFRSNPTPTVTAIHHDRIEIRHRRVVSHFYPFGPRGQVYLWEAFMRKGGP